MKSVLFCSSFFIVFSLNAQKVNQLIEKGNADYKKKAFVKADQQYTKALEKDARNTVAQFNSGNARQQLKKYDDAARAYDAAASNTDDPSIKAKAFYNQGLSYVRQSRLKEAIESFKKSLRLNPNDQETRENLQKALKEQQQQQQPQNNDQQKNKDNKKQKDKKQPKPQQPKLSREEAEKMLNNLRREEKNLQKEVQRKNQSGRQLKDW